MHSLFDLCIKILQDNIDCKYNTVIFLNYVSPLQGSGDILFFPLASVCLSVGLSVRHKIVSAL